MENPMPYEMSSFQLPCGRRGVRLDLRGTVTGEETAALLKEVDPGGALHRQPCLVLTKDLDSFSPEARRIASGGGRPWEPDMWSAVVVTKLVIRVLINFLARVSQSRRLKLFASEPEAIQWLDERAREEAVKAK
jgi:hypothetical protein